MATQLFLLDTPADTILGTGLLNLIGAADTWEPLALGLARGSGVVAGGNTTTVTGATPGVEVWTDAGANNAEWISPPVSADVTISGTITINVWAAENNMSANVAINAVIEVIRANATGGTDGTNTIVEIARSTRVVEVAVTTRAVNNFTVTPTSTVVNRGDRLRVRVFGDDAGTMASGFTFNASWNGTTAAADGDTYVTFTETFAFDTAAPSGTTYYLTNSVSPVTTALVDRVASTSRGSGVQTDVTADVPAGAPTQVTDTAAGTAVQWFTDELSAFTLTGLARANIWEISNSLGGHSLRCEIARVNSDGSGETVWSTWCLVPVTAVDAFGGTALVDTAWTFNLSGDDLAISATQRLRFRIYVSNTERNFRNEISTISYAVATAAATGDSWFTLPAVAGPPAAEPRNPAVNFQDPGVLMRALRRPWHHRRSGIFVPDLWLPA